ncbi:MAG: polysaccharide pyruvyl transferase family protein, partial [Actinomycetota bacterium]
AFYRGLVIELAERGHQVRLLCNGAAEDRAAVEAIASHQGVAELTASGRVEVAPTPQTGAELAGLVAPCAAVIAHRLHACILAYSYRVPVVGLSWDSKLDAFFESVDLENLLISDPLVRSAAAADLVEAAMARGIDPEAHAAVVKECRHGLQRVWRASGLLPQEAKASS